MKTKSKKAKAESANYLDYVPMHNEDKYPFQTDDNGAVTIMVENKGVFNKIAQVVFRKPRISKIHLDEMGNFIWPYIDGARTIYDISELVHEHFGDKAEPLYTELDLSDNDKIVYLGNYEYYLDEGDGKVTGLSGEQIEKNNLVNYVDDNRNISNIPESAYLEYDYNNVSVCSEIVDPIGHANANYGGPFSYTRRIDYWTNYMDYYTTEFGNRNQYTNHCGPTAITNLIAAFRNRYPAGAAGIPNDNDTLFLTIADKGILNNFFSNTDGTPNNRAYYYIDYIFDMYGITPYQMYEIPSNADDIDEYEFPMGYNAIFYMSLKKESTYGAHAVIAYGLSEMENQATGAQKAYFHIADGWSESPRYIELNSDIACAVGIQFYY